MSGDTVIQLRVKALALEAGPLRLCENLSFELKASESLILRGANGSGKTTLLRTLAGFNRAPQGEISFTSNGSTQAIRLADNCHYFGHKNALKTAHTVRQNLEFFARFNGVAIETIKHIAAELNLQPLLDLPVQVLSAGQTRRAAFARLLIAPRAVWLLDEPTAALDVSAAHLIEQHCAKHLTAGGIIIAATHLPFLDSYAQSHSLNMSDYRPNTPKSVTESMADEAHS